MNIKSQQGQSGLLLLLVALVIIFGLFIGADLGYIFYLEECGDEPLKNCLLDSNRDREESNENEEGEVETVTATGGLSEKGYSASVTMTFPLEGGSVTGTVSGDCSGKVEGEYTGGDSGAISGKIFGSCSPFFVPIPAKGTFSGVVNQENKTVPITGTGSAAGFSGSRSIVLTY